MTTLLIGPLGVPELLIILAIVLLLFGGARLAGLGKSTGRALREFKEETRELKDKEAQAPAQGNPPPVTAEQPPAAPAQQPPTTNVHETPSSSEVRKDT
jgi:sec-independent protein translocase protein TatA